MEIWKEPVYAPLQEIRDEITVQAQVQLYLKREDLIHPHISGNKWRKLKYNLREARAQGKQTLLTFGGAFSNHIYAVAAAGELSGFQTIGLIRGEQHVELNPTLSFATKAGMYLQYLSREDYRRKEEPSFLKLLEDKYGDFYILPEGGSNALAVKGCAEIIADIPMPYDYLCCPCGTGGTFAGLIAGTHTASQTLMGFSALKGGAFLAEEVKQCLAAYEQIEPGLMAVPSISWCIQTDYHFGGYAKITTILLDFIRWFERTHVIALEQVYTGKMIYGLYDLLKQGYFKPGSVIVAIHTGGLQGRSPLLNQP
jgi:1-aminocyclopropane-1-carboxylate deaminase